MAGFIQKWGFRRTFLRFSLWFLVMLAIKPEPVSVLVVGLGFIISELGALLLRRRLRIDIANEISNGNPLTHLIPYAVGILYLVITQIIRLSVNTEILQGRIEFGPMALIAFFSVTALWGWATMVTVSVVDLVRPGQIHEDADGIGAGEVIGVLERMATFVLVASGAFTAVGFVIAAKAAARFPLFKEKAFAEYFLIGTLTSVGLALLLGLVVLAGR
jgi:hypothetical protein